MHRTTQSDPSKRGFTLIELIVVIAIIAILAAILFPVFATAREKARQIACISNMSQIAKGLAMYQSDYEGYFPPSQLPTGIVPNGSPVWSWPTIMFSYVKANGVFTCPSGDNHPMAPDATYFPGLGKVYTDTTDNDGTANVPGVNPISLSYGRNLIPYGGWKSPGFVNNYKSGFVVTGTTISLSDAKVADPAGTIHIMDAITGASPAGTPPYNNPNINGNSIRGISQEIRTDRYKDNTASKVSYRHAGGFCALHGDGHAKWHRWGSTKACDWSVQDDTCP